MSHSIHEPNHAGDCIFCGKHVGKSYKMASSAQANLTDTNQASELYELCKEVYERLEWQIDDATWVVGDENGDLFILTKEVEAQGYYDYYAPLYTSDYLLEKLPISVESEWSHSGNNELTIVKLDGKYSASYLHGKEDRVALVGSTNLIGVADTPLKALLKLTIALSEAGELK